jgi:hypothetical protein
MPMRPRDTHLKWPCHNAAASNQMRVSMNGTIESDAQGSLVAPAGVVPPLTRFSLEPHGDVLILRREPSRAEEWWGASSPEQRVAWLREWIGSLQPGAPLPREANGLGWSTERAAPRTGAARGQAEACPRHGKLRAPDLAH